MNYGSSFVDVFASFLFQLALSSVLDACMIL